MPVVSGSSSLSHEEQVEQLEQVGKGSNFREVKNQNFSIDTESLLIEADCLRLDRRIACPTLPHVQKFVQV